MLSFTIILSWFIEVEGNYVVLPDWSESFHIRTSKYPEIQHESSHSFPDHVLKKRNPINPLTLSDISDISAIISAISAISEVQPSYIGPGMGTIVIKRRMDGNWPLSQFQFCHLTTTCVLGGLWYYVHAMYGQTLFYYKHHNAFLVLFTQGGVSWWEKTNMGTTEVWMEINASDSLQ